MSTEESEDAVSLEGAGPPHPADDGESPPGETEHPPSESEHPPSESEHPPSESEGGHSALDESLDAEHAGEIRHDGESVDGGHSQAEDLVVDPEVNGEHADQDAPQLTKEKEEGGEGGGEGGNEEEKQPISQGDSLVSEEKPDNPPDAEGNETDGDVTDASDGTAVHPSEASEDTQDNSGVKQEKLDDDGKEEIMDTAQLPKKETNLHLAPSFDSTVDNISPSSHTLKRLSWSGTRDSGERRKDSQSLKSPPGAIHGIDQLRPPRLWSGKPDIGTHQWIYHPVATRLRNPFGLPPPRSPPPGRAAPGAQFPASKQSLRPCYDPPQSKLCCQSYKRYLPLTAQYAGPDRGRGVAERRRIREAYCEPHPKEIIQPNPARTVPMRPRKFKRMTWLESPSGRNKKLDAKLKEEEQRNKEGHERALKLGYETLVGNIIYYDIPRAKDLNRSWKHFLDSDPMAWGFPYAPGSKERPRLPLPAPYLVHQLKENLWRWPKNKLIAHSTTSDSNMS